MMLIDLPSRVYQAEIVSLMPRIAYPSADHLDAIDNRKALTWHDSTFRKTEEQTEQDKPGA